MNSANPLVPGLSLNTATVREQWNLAQMIEACARHGIPGISPWRDKLAELGKLTLAFNRMSREVSSANAARRQMTADVAHELRTPLTVIAGYIEAMRAFEKAGYDVIVIDSSTFSDELLPAPSLYKPAATAIEAVPLLPAVGVKVAV